MKSLNLVATLGVIGICLAASTVSAVTMMERQAVAAEQKRVEAEKDAAATARFEAALPERMAVVNAVVNRYARELLGSGLNGVERLNHFAMFVHTVPSTVLTRAGSARSAAEFSTQVTKVMADPVATKALGDVYSLIFLPIGPCRFADSRLSSGGALPTGVSRQYANFSAAGQGGAAGCNVGGTIGVNSGTPGAIAMNIAVTGATAQGYVIARPVGSTNLTSAINFVAGQDLSNATVIPMTGTGGNDFEIRPVLNAGGATVDVVLDLLGFYVTSKPTPLECVDTALTTGTTGTNPSIETSATAPACATGYTRVSMSCFENDDAVLTDIAVSSGSCAYIPRVATATSFNVGARCCRVPGNGVGVFPP